MFKKKNVAIKKQEPIKEEKKTSTKSSSNTGTKIKKTSISKVVTDEQIRAHAYNIWVSKGRLHGSDLENWIQAKKELQKNGSSLN